MAVGRRTPIGGTWPQRRALLLKLAPLLLFFGLTVGVGTVHALLQSLWLAGPPKLAAGSGVDWSTAYRELFASPEFLRSVGHSLYVAAVSAIVSVAIGTVFAYVLWRAPVPIAALGSLYRLPIIFPHIAVAYLTLLFWSRTGLVAALVQRVGGSIDQMPPLLYRPHGIGMILAYVYKEFPFVALMVGGALRTVPEQHLINARMLGADTVQVLFRVIVPLLSPLLNQLFFMLFLYALGGFDIPYLLGAGNPPMLPIRVFQAYFHGSLADRAGVMATLSLLAAVAVLFVLSYSRAARRLSRWEGGIS